MTNLQVIEGSGEKGEYFVRKTTGTIQVSTEAAQIGAVRCVLNVSGLSGGFCYKDTDKKRGNALKVLVNALVTLYLYTDMRVASLKSLGNEDKIPTEAEAILFLPQDQVQKAKQLIRGSFSDMKKELADTEPKFLLELSVHGEDKKARVYKEEVQSRVIGLLMYLPNGVRRMSESAPGIVETLTNLAALTQENGKLIILTSQRSLVATELDNICETIEHFFQCACAQITSVEIS